MNKYLIVVLIVFSNLSVFAQCSLSIFSQNKCYDGESAYVQVLASNVVDIASIEWDVSPSDGVDFGILNGTIYNQLYATFSEPGLYTISMSSNNCSEQSLEFIVYPLTEVFTNVQSEYQLCNGNSLINFQVLNDEDFVSTLWSNIEVGDNILSYTDESQFQVNFNQPENFTLVLQTTDSNDCEVLNEIPVVVSEGPNVDDVTIFINNDEIQCVESGANYDLEISVQSDFDIQSFSPENFNIQASSDPFTLSDEYQIPIEISFTNDCILNYNQSYSHSLNHSVSFTTDFDGILCNGEQITITNTSPHLTGSTAPSFSWGYPSSTEVIEETSSSITIVYSEDGTYNLSLTYDDGQCLDTYEDSIVVDVDNIDLSYSVDKSVICDDQGEIILTNTSEISNPVSTYSWELSHSSGSNQTSSSISPIFTIAELGAWDASLTVTTVTGCSETLEEEGITSLVGASSFTTDFDGILCNGEQITITNTSPHLTGSTAPSFSWGYPSSTEVIEETSSSITIVYSEDGTYNLSLTYDDGQCLDTYEDSIVVDVDNIDLSYSVDKSVICDDQGEIILTNTSEISNPVSTYSWELSHSSGSNQTSSSISPIFTIAELGAWDASLTVTTVTGCSETLEEEGITSLVGASSFTTDFDGILCNGEQITITNTSPHLTGSTAPSFSWGYPSSTEVIEETSSSITIVYSEDGTYNLSLTYDDGQCLDTYEDSIVVDVDNIDLSYSVDKSVICDDQGEIILTNTSEISNPVSTYSWELSHSSGSNQTSSSISPIFTIAELGAWDASLTVTTVTGCSETLEEEGITSLVGASSFTTDFDGILCNGEQITITNTSPHLTGSTAPSFSWGYPSSTEVIEETSSSITIVYSEDGTYNLSLTYDDGQCLDTYEDSIVVDVDNIDLSYSVDKSVICDDQGEIILTNTSEISNPVSTYSWELSHSSGSNQTSSSISPIFTIAELGAWDASLTVTTVTGCSETLEEEGITSLVGASSFTTDFDGILCNGEQITITNTSPHLTGSTAPSFSWGYPSSTEVIEETSSSITIVYSEDGTYNLSLTYDDGQCLDTYEDSIVVDVDNIDLSYSVDKSVICDDQGEIILTNTSEISNPVSTYSWELSHSSGSNQTSSSISPIFTIAELGAWDASLTVTTVTGCSETLEEEGITSLVGASSFTTDFDGILCNGEQITITNTSPHLTGSTAPSFSWGYPSSTEVIEETSSSITIVYSEDGTYNLSLTYDDGQCLGTYEDSIVVDVDNIDPEIIGPPSITSCLLQNDLNIIDQTVLDNNTDSYQYLWNLVPENLSYDNSISLIGNEENFELSVISLEQMAYDLELQIINENTGCFGQAIYEDYLNIYAVDVAYDDSSLSFCDVANFSTDDIIYESEDPTHTYQWNLTDTTGSINQFDGYSYDFEISSVGSYTLDLIVSNEYCETSYTTTSIVVQQSPIIDGKFLDTTICNLPNSLLVDISDNSISSAENVYNWSLINEIGELVQNDSTEDLNIELTQNGQYTVKLFVSNSITGCIYEDSFIINVESIEASIQSTYNEVCDESEVIITVDTQNQLENYEWNLYASGDLLLESNQPIFNEFLGIGSYDVELIVESPNGCISAIDSSNYINVNSFNTAITPVNPSICFNGSSSVSERFSSSVSALYTGLPYDIINYSWEIVSSNSETALQQSVDTFSVDYVFTEAGSYTLLYTVWLDGTNSECVYSDQVIFNVGLSASISYDEVICVGEDFAANSTVDLWSSDHSYQWSSSPELLLSDPTSPSTGISTTTSLGAGLLDTYSIALLVTNDVGCWEEVIGEIDAYEVVADFTVSDSLLHCSAQQSELISLNNYNINEWSWLVSESSSSTQEYQIDSIYTHDFTDQGYSDISLSITSEHGCTDNVTYEESVLLNDYTASISSVNPSICFNGSSSVSESFSSSVSALYTGLPYDIINYSWEIVSSNSETALQQSVDTFSVDYVFTEAGSYTLLYTVWLDGTNSECVYSDQVIFNVGLSASISYDEVICVEKDITAISRENIVANSTLDFAANSTVDLWSSDHSYQWSSSPELLLSDPTSPSTGISTTTSLGAGLLDTYSIALLVTNDVGCWEEVIGEIDAYEVVADFTVSDSLLHCSAQQSELISLNNYNINEWSWLVSESSSSTQEYQIDSIYTHDFTDQGYSDISLSITSEHGCTDNVTYEESVLLNDYTASISSVNPSICFNGSSSVSESFSSSVSALYTGLPYDIINYSWEIVSSNSETALQQSVDTFSVDYVFTEAGSYTLLYTVWLDGTNSECVYSDQVIFNVGLSASISYDEVICVGEDFAANSTVDLWSSDHSYQWSSSPELLLSDPTSPSTGISTTTSLGAGLLDTYSIALLVTNDVGCWEEVIGEIDAYEVVADFTVSDSLLHCSAQQSELISLNNYNINEWSWLVSESSSSTQEYQIDSIYTHDFTDQGYSDISLSITSEHGCTDNVTYEESVLLNDYTASISSVNPSICFNGSSSVSESFSSSVSALYTGLPYDIINYSWEIVSSNSETALQQSVDTFSVDYVFTEAGSYTLLYTVWLDGTNSECVYSDQVIFNVGLSASISYDEVICVGEDFAANSTVDLWSSDHSYQWSSSPELLLSDPTSPSTGISTTTSLGAGLLDTYSIALLVTNDVGCWEEVIGEIDAYEVVADFTVSDSLLHCSPQMINIESINNYHITNWEWNVFDGDGEELNPELYFTGINLSEEVLLTDISNYNISLDITSLEGCSSSYSISPAVILNQFNPEIVELDDNQCFNGQNQIVKSLGIELNASYPTEYSISSFEWEVYPEAELINMTDSHVYILFEESSNYLVTYRMTVENGTGEDCVYYTQAEYEIGVNANIQAPDIICVGEEFDVTAEVSVGIGANSMFLWSSSDSLQFSSPNNLASTIISNQNYQGDSTELIVVDFIVTNDNGCWEQTTDSIKVYELVADFIASDAGEICAPVILNFNSLYNNFVSSYEWSYKGVNYLDEEFSYTYPEDTLIYGDFFNEMAIYNIGLVVHSLEGCADTIVKDSLLDIKRPYPYFTLEQNNICDGTEVSIIDSSSYSSNVGLFTQGVFYDSTFYNLEGITNIVYEFPYDLSEELVYHHPVTLNAFLGQCSGSYTDTIVIYPNPQIDIVLSDTLGCPPYTILFGDSVSYVDTDQSEFYWEIASQNSNLQMDSVSFNEVGSYSVFHSVLSENNCFSDITLVDTINIYQNPIASYTYTANVFCYGEADVDFENTSFYVTDSIFSLWSVSTSDVFNATGDNPSIHFEETEDVLVTLEIVDEHGCIDDTTQTIEMIVLDTLVSSPNLDFVSVNEYGVSIQWNQIQDDLFDNLSIYHSQNNNNWSEVFNTSDLIPNSFTHVIDVNVVNEYKIVQQDSCGFYSDSSRVHNSILLQANTDNYQNVNLSWTNYVGWDSVDSYRIYRREENGNFSLIAQLNGDVLSYEDINLCNRFYHYYVLASHNDQEFYSYSNVESLEPLFVDYSIPLDVRYTTVVDHSIITQWEGFYESDMTFYNIDRWDDYFGWVEDYDISSESPYIDNDVGVHHREYIYRISYEDECGNSGPHSNHGTNVLLQGDQFKSHIALYWSNYEDWDSGVLSYVLEYRNETTQEFEFVQEFSSETFNYIDSDLNRMGTDTSYCYRLIAKSYDNSKQSVSNIPCFTSMPSEYFPTAFTPNGDGLNDVFKYYGNDILAIELQVFDRWGDIVYESNYVDFMWDGSNKENGYECKLGNYVVKYIIYGLDGSVIKNSSSLMLLR